MVSGHSQVSRCLCPWSTVYAASCKAHLAGSVVQVYVRYSLWSRICLGVLCGLGCTPDSLWFRVHFGVFSVIKSVPQMFSVVGGGPQGVLCGRKCTLGCSLWSRVYLRPCWSSLGLMEEGGQQLENPGPDYCLAAFTRSGFWVGGPIAWTL